MKNRTILLLGCLLGMFGQSQANEPISTSIIGHWFVVERNYHYASKEGVNEEENVTYHFVFQEDGTGYWMVETEKTPSNGKPERKEEKFNYKWKFLDNKVVLDFYEMNRTFESKVELSAGVLTLSDPENKTRQYSKKQD
jgi:hypothetical protein